MAASTTKKAASSAASKSAGASSTAATAPAAPAADAAPVAVATRTAVPAPAAVQATGIASGARWFDKVSTRLDKMPLFGEALATTALAWSDSLVALSGAAPVFSFAGLADTKVAGLLRRRGADPVFAVLDAPGWSTQVGLQFDRAFVSTVVEALFGGADEEFGPGKPDGPLSAVETRIAEVAAGQAAEALRAGFAGILPTAFRVMRVQSKPDLLFLGRPNAAVVVGSLRLVALGHSVGIDLLVPRAALDAFAERLAVLPADEPPCADPRWCEQLEGEVSRALMSLEAIIELKAMTLGSIAKLQPGSLLPLPRNAANNVRLLCEGKDLFRCDLGQSSGLYTVRVEEPTAELPSRKDEALAW